MFEGVLRFWLDRGVDGFRIDVAHGLSKADGPARPGPAAGRVQRRRLRGHRGHHGRPDAERRADVGPAGGARGLPRAGTGSSRSTTATGWPSPRPGPPHRRRWLPTCGPTSCSQAFNFAWLLAEWSATAFADVITGTLAAVEPVGASPTWVLSNHDVVRHPTRYGGGERGLARARAAALTMLALPGSAYLYQGEELGLEQVEVAPEFRQDPSWFRTGDAGRDGCRVPIPWGGAEPPFGFGPGEGQPWIPQPDGVGDAHCRGPA